MEKNEQTELKKAFRKGLLRWNQLQNTRAMPWKGEKDPYKIWLSEIILQQTRVEQGLSYYSNFLKAFPDIHKLAGASDEKVFKLWEGLGYYSRCRNLLHTARYISRELKGKFPDNYTDIKALKGIGPYTAAAIASFAFNLPYAVVDGNVFRVLARFFGLSIPTDSAAGKKTFTELAGELIDTRLPGVYNQAIMDFGAVVCKPAAPQCSTCVFNKKCIAYRTGKVDELPLKEKKITIRKRWFYYIVAVHNGKIAVRQRKAKDIWQGLYEFPLMEATAEWSGREIKQQLQKQELLKGTGFEVLSVSEMYKQQLSHQFIAGQFITVTLKSISGNKSDAVTGDILWTTKAGLRKFAWPGFINQYLKSQW